ncbi:MAG: hypothetical protein FWG67_04315 [Defluviitaleaceae bacterium]|nr:hypothetical protein [Defluviitaleaceae bacterium]
MIKYQLRFYFEHGGICIWGINNATKEQYGYAIEHTVLPISQALKDELNALEEEYANYLDWDDPLGPSPWSESQKVHFLEKSNLAYEKLKYELSLEFEVINYVSDCIER